MKARDGFILQAVGPCGERRYFVRQGFGGDRSGRPVATLGAQLTAVCDELDALPGEWRIETISTPATIYRDLRGGRMRLAPRDIRRNGYGEPMVPETVQTPEVLMLSRIGRLDLLAS